MMYKEINVKKVLYKTLITTNFYSKNTRSLFKSVKNKVILFVAHWVGEVGNRANTGWLVQKVNPPH